MLCDHDTGKTLGLNPLLESAQSPSFRHKLQIYSSRVARDACWLVVQHHDPRPLLYESTVNISGVCGFRAGGVGSIRERISLIYKYEAAETLLARLGDLDCCTQPSYCIRVERRVAERCFVDWCSTKLAYRVNFRERNQSCMCARDDFPVISMSPPLQTLVPTTKTV